MSVVSSSLKPSPGISRPGLGLRDKETTDISGYASSGLAFDLHRLATTCVDLRGLAWTKYSSQIPEFPQSHEHPGGLCTCICIGTVQYREPDSFRFLPFFTKHTPHPHPQEKTPQHWDPSTVKEYNEYKKELNFVPRKTLFWTWSVLVQNLKESGACSELDSSVHQI